MNHKDSIETTNDKQSKTHVSQRSSFIEQINNPGPAHKKYGNMLVLLTTNRIVITLGPDYLCFLAAFTCFLFAGCYLIKIFDESVENVLLKIANITIVVVQLGSYLLVALSNPGIVFQSSLLQQSQHEEDVKRYCRKCRLQMRQKMYHCSSCDVCISEYDHHCPWVSKCIGAANLKYFYFFVGITPFYIMYYIIVFFTCFAISSSKKHNLPY